MINPKTLSWTAPETNEDGSPITGTLEYEVGVQAGETFEPTVVIPGQLQPDGAYQAHISQLSLGKGDHVLALRTFTKEQPSVKSSWSESVAFTIAGVPKPPLELRVA